MCLNVTDATRDLAASLAQIVKICPNLSLRSIKLLPIHLYLLPPITFSYITLQWLRESNITLQQQSTHV